MLHDAEAAMRDFPRRGDNADGSPSWWTGEEEAGAEFMQLVQAKAPAGVRVADPTADAIDRFDRDTAAAAAERGTA